MKDNVFGTFVSSLLKLLEDNFRSKAAVAVPEILQALIYTLRNIQHNKIRSQQARLVRILVTAVDCDPSCAPLALEALALLPENHASWTQIVDPTIEAMHYILHHLYEGFEIDSSFKSLGSIDESSPSIIADTLQLFVAETRHKRADINLSLRRLSWMTEMLDALLKVGPSAVVAVPVEAMLDLAEHLLLLDGSVIKSKELVLGLESSEIVSIIPRLHQLAFKIIETLILTYVLNCSRESFAMLITDGAFFSNLV